MYSMEEEEPETEKSVEKTEPSHYSTLDPKIMKVGDLRDELELRNASAKGLKSQLIARLTKLLKAEQEKEMESKKELEAEKDTNKSADIREKEKAREEDEKNELKRKEEEELQKKEKREKALLERRYKLPDAPSVIVHPSATAKGGKFDCTTVSLSVLLDYRPEDNKEHSFEVSLFAELFNEMLMRDFGFQIYSAIACSSPKKEEDKKKDDDKKKEEKKDKEEKKEKDEKDKKDEKKSRNEDPSPKRRKTDEKDEREETVDDENNDVDKEDDLEGKDEEAKHDKDKDDKKKKKEEERKRTTNPGLLLAFSYFDQNHCGYLSDKDTEDIIHTLGLKLSRAQIKKLLQKVIHRENFKYRKLTDQTVNEKDQPEESDESEAQPKPDVEQLARGNRENLRKLLELSGAKSESVPMSTTGQVEGDNPSFIYYKGALLDIESLMQRLDRSDKSRAALEKSTQDLTDELKTVKHTLSAKEDSCTKLEQDLHKTKRDLDQERIRSSSAETLNKDWHRLASDSKGYLMNALNCMNTMLNSKKEGKSKSEDSQKNSQVKTEDSKDRESKGYQDLKKEMNK